jgi:hypothetical protein
MSEQYNAKFYRTNHYSCIEDAEKNGAFSYWEMTYGYSSTMDSLTNVRNVLDRYDRSLINEYRFVWTIDGVKFPEMTYGQTIDLIDASDDYFATNKKDFFLNLNKPTQMEIKATTIHAIIERKTEINHSVYGRLYVVEHLTQDNKSHYRRVQNWETNDLTVDISEEHLEEIYDLVATHHNTPYAYFRNISKAKI